LLSNAHVLYTPLCFIIPRSQPGQTSTGDVAKRDLRAELQLAEHEARNKKRKAEGLPPLPFSGSASTDTPKGLLDAPPPDEEANKRRKLLQEALDLDRDDSESDDSDAEEKRKEKGKARATEGADAEADANGDVPMKSGAKGDASDESDEDESDEEDEDEDETAVLLRELEKIKRERAEEKARAEAAERAGEAASHEAHVATANPLLNLAAALGADTPAGVNTTVPGTFAVKRRWDDGEW
jgi:protein CWC15